MRQAGHLGPTLPPGQVLGWGEGGRLTLAGLINHMADWAVLAGEAQKWGGEATRVPPTSTKRQGSLDWTSQSQQGLCHLQPPI